MNDIKVKDLQGRVIGYICICGTWWYPAHGVNKCPCEVIHPDVETVDRNHGLSREKAPRKYRKFSKGQKSIELEDVLQLFGNPY